jgi:glycosyltransferase involved in cell wall biosynthesis
MKPTVSVIIPTYNLASHLTEAVASVRDQHCPNLEIIVVDDGSTDDTAKVLDALAATGDLRWFHQDNAGAAAARNRGIQEAQGEWIAFLDADDLWLSGKLAAQFEKLRQHPEAMFSYTDVRLRSESNVERDLECGTDGQSLFLRLLGGNLFATPTVIIRRDCFEEIGLFDTELRTGEDWDMWMRLATHFAHVRVAKPLALIRESRSKFPVRTIELCTLRVLERLFACPRVSRDWPEVASKRPFIYAWHYSVLAKSYLEQGQSADFGRCAYRALRSHPAAFRYLLKGRRKDFEDRFVHAT